MYVPPQLNNDALDEILDRSFALCYKLRRFDIATRIRSKHPVSILIWEGQEVDDSRDSLNAFANIKFNNGWKAMYVDGNWMDFGYNYTKLISALYRTSSSDMKYKAGFKVSETEELPFSYFQYDSFYNSMVGILDVFINLETTFPKRNVPLFRSIYEKDTYLFKDLPTGQIHLGVKDRVFVKNVLRSDLVNSYMRNQIKYLGFKKFKAKYDGNLEIAIELLDSMYCARDLSKLESSDSFNMEPAFASEDYRIQALKINARIRISFQVPTEDDFSSFFVLIDYFLDSWRVTASLDQYIAGNWIKCKDLPSLITLLRKSVISNNLFEHANILYFIPEMSFFSFEFKTIDSLLCLYRTCQLSELVHPIISKIYYNCHNGHCKVEKCKFGIYLFRDHKGTHLGYRNYMLVEKIEDSELYQHMEDYKFLLRENGDINDIDCKSAVRYLEKSENVDLPPSLLEDKIKNFSLSNNH
eukprot:NODE_3_length_56144_cov_0.348184.p9 type:complete len:469 gc:universal NODE_3_length_56144_cov_0.348184:37469-38875(+)